METCCGYGYDLARKSHTLTRIFKGQKKRTGHSKTAVLYGNNIRISARSDSTEFVPYKEERTLPRTPADESEIVCVTALNTVVTLCPISASRFGNINPIPFRPKSGIVLIDVIKIKPAFRTAFAYRLGPTDPCSNAVHMEPFSTSAFKVLV